MKCDEQRPSCHRCLSTGRNCDRYESIRIAQPINQEDGTLVLKWIQPSPQPPESNTKEQAAFYHFRMDILESLAKPFDSSVWLGQVLPVSMTESAVWHAVVALGSLTSDSNDEDARESTQYALQHYSKALKALQSRLAAAEKVPRHLTLLICLLFYTFEVQQQAFGEAQSHLYGGLKIIQEYESRARSSLELSNDNMDPLIEAFERLDVQMSSFTSSPVYLKRDTGKQQFANPSDAMRTLNHLTGRMRDLLYAVEEQRSSPGGLSQEHSRGFQTAVVHQLSSLREWELAMNELQQTLTSQNDLIGAKILHMREITCKVRISNCLTDGREMLLDSYLQDFERLCELGESVQEMQSTGPGKFTLDTGIMPTVYYTVLKCRDPKLRRRALAILQNCKQQEGAWDGPTIAQMAEDVMKVEESGLGEIHSACDVPEKNRLYQAYYDLRFSSKMLECKRRRFESDGAWIEYMLPLD